MPFQIIVLSLLNGWKKDHLRLAVSEDVSLANLLLEHKPDIVRIAKSLAFVYSNQSDELNLKSVLAWLKESRPDFYEVFEGKEAKLWLSKQIKELKEVLWNG